MDEAERVAKSSRMCCVLPSFLDSCTYVPSDSRNGVQPGMRVLSEGEDGRGFEPVRVHPPPRKSQYGAVSHQTNNAALTGSAELALFSTPRNAGSTIGIDSESVWATRRSQGWSQRWPNTRRGPCGVLEERLRNAEYSSCPNKTFPTHVARQIGAHPLTSTHAMIGDLIRTFSFQCYLSVPTARGQMFVSLTPFSRAFLLQRSNSPHRPRSPRSVNIVMLVGELRTEAQRLVAEGHPEAAELVYKEALRVSHCVQRDSTCTPRTHAFPRCLARWWPRFPPCAPSQTNSCEPLSSSFPPSRLA